MSTAFASGESDGATSVRSALSASSSTCCAIASASAPTCLSTWRTTSSWSAAQSRWSESRSRLPHSSAFCAARWSRLRVASLKYSVTSVCSILRRGEVAAPALPPAGRPPPKPSKKSEKNSSNRLRPPRGDVRPCTSARCSSHRFRVTTRPFSRIRTVATAGRTPSMSHSWVAISLTSSSPGDQRRSGAAVDPWAPAASHALAIAGYRKSDTHLRLTVTWRYGQRDRHLRCRLLLGRRVGVPAAAGRRLHGRGLHGRLRGRADVRAGLHRSHGPRRGGRGRLRARRDLLRRAPGRVLGRARPHAAEPPGAGRGHAVPVRGLLPLTRAGARGARVARAPAGAAVAADRDRGRGRVTLLAGRGLPPAVLREARHGAGLQERRPRFGSLREGGAAGTPQPPAAPSAAPTRRRS